jgi:hypothetical protein
MKAGRTSDVWKSDRVPVDLKDYHRDKYWDHVALVLASAGRVHTSSQLKVFPSSEEAFSLRERIARADFDFDEFKIVREELALLEMC